MTPHASIDALKHARVGILDALEQWNPTDLSQVYRCNSLLEDVANALREFKASLENGEQSPREARPIVADIGQAAGRMNQRIDACLAFQRGLLLRLGESGPVYGATGAPVDDSSRAELRGVEA
jgi:hypothetical protein